MKKFFILLCTALCVLLILAGCAGNYVVNWECVDAPIKSDVPMETFSFIRNEVQFRKFQESDILFEEGEFAYEGVYDRAFFQKYDLIAYVVWSSSISFHDFFVSTLTKENGKWMLDVRPDYEGEALMAMGGVYAYFLTVKKDKSIDGVVLIDREKATEITY